MRSKRWIATVMLVIPTAAWPWEYIPGRDPGLQSHSRSMLVNPDPNAFYLLRSAPAILSLECRKGRRRAWINHNFEVEAKSAVVSTSLDGGATVTETWNADTTISLRPPNPVLFAARLRGHQTLRMTVAWLGAAPSSTEFEISGFEAALKPLHAACGW